MINPNLIFGGGMEHALTFLLVAAIVYAVFAYVRGSNKEFFLKGREAGIVSVVIGLFAAIDPTITRTMQAYMPLFVGLLALFFIIMLVQKATERKDGKGPDTKTLGVILLVLVVLVSAIGMDTLERYIGLGAENVFWGAGILVLGALLWNASVNKKDGNE